jgi:hypothetical protein
MTINESEGRTYTMSTTKITPETMDSIVQNAAFAADNAVIGFEGTGAAKTRAAVIRAVEFLIGNGLVAVVDPEYWPTWLKMDPPYPAPLPLLKQSTT